MTCDRAHDLLDAYGDGELTDSLVGAVRRHIELCEPCDRDLRFAMAQRRRLRQVARAEGAPAELVRRVLGELASHDGARRKR